MVDFLVSSPASEPVSLEEVKNFLGIDADDETEDFALLLYLTAARTALENFTGRAFITQTRAVSFDRFAPCGFLELPRPPLVSVDFVKYTVAAESITVGTDKYSVEIHKEPGAIRWADDFSLPFLGPALFDGQPISHGLFWVQFVCGYGDEGEDVPAALRLAILKDIQAKHDGCHDVLTSEAFQLAYPFRQLVV